MKMKVLFISVETLRRPTEVLRKKRDFFFSPWEIQPPVLFAMMLLGCEVGSEFRSSPAVPKCSL